MYHYQSCGLNTIYLVNGYHEIETPYGKAVSIDDVEGLDRAIAHGLITYKARITGSEFRFLRKYLGLSQAKLALLLGNNEQAIALWEKKAISHNGQLICLGNWYQNILVIIKHSWRLLITLIIWIKLSMMNSCASKT